MVIYYGWSPDWSIFTIRGMQRVISIPDTPKPTELINLQEVMRRISLSRSTVYRWMRLGRFPKQAKKENGTTSALWFKDEVDAFIATLRNPASGSPAPPPSITPNTNSRQSPAEIRLTSHSPQLGVTQDKPASSKKLRPLGIGSEACLIVGPLLIGTQEAFFDPQSGRIFEVIGQLTIRQPKTVSKSVQKRWQADDAEDGQ